MKTYIDDVVQVTLAIVFTVGIVASAAPMPTENVKKPLKKVQIAAVVKEPAPEAKTPVVAPPVQPEAPIEVPAPAPVVQTNFTPSGNKQTWLEASGIPADQWQYVDSIVSRESGWNPCAYNPGQSDCNANPTSACGLVQSLPCGKQSAYGHWTDPVANLKWQYDYVTQRYGGYAQAVAFWNSHSWY